MTGHDLLGIGGLSMAYLSGRLGPSAVLEDTLSRIAAADNQLCSFVAIDADRARQAAAAMEQELSSGRWRGPLHGVPVGVKELFDVAGLPATYGSQALAGAVAPADSEVVRRLRRAGAVIVGLTRSHEFGWGITTQHPDGAGTRNPCNPDFISGGSSGGSAAAVAAGLVPAAVATDTGGSIRIPAALCGVAGIKPTFGRVPRDGSVPLAPSLDTPGFLARTPGDLAILLKATAGLSASDPATRIPGMARPGPPPSTLTGCRVGVSPDLIDTAMTAPHAAAYQHAIDVLTRLGAEIIELRLPAARLYREAFNVIQMAEAYDVHHRRLGLFPDRAPAYGEDVRQRLERARSVDIGTYLAACDSRLHLVAALDAALASVDVMLTPVNPSTPPRRTDPDHLIAPDGTRQPFRDFIMGYTVPQNLAGVPSVPIPAGTDEMGIPIGIQLTAARGQELIALQLAEVLDRELADLGGVGFIAGAPTGWITQTGRGANGPGRGSGIACHASFLVPILRRGPAREEVQRVVRC
jgi:aspartyl-tRNA(Asn)/glutamyl-tRNA(Gln) amidotransferase subunit A